MAAVVLTSVTIVSLIAACSTGGSGKTSTSPANTAITIAEPTEPISLDPCNSQLQDTGYVLVGNVLQALTTIDPANGKTVPQLATSWKENSTTDWTFKLKSGVKFSDGAAFDATAAAYNINRLVNGTSADILACANRSNWAGETVVTKVTNATTLEITTSVPDPVLPTRLVWTEMSSPDATPTDTLTKTPIGTGPYEVEKYTPTVSLVLSRYAKYAGPKPAVAKATYVWRAATSVRADMISTNEADIALGLAPQDVAGVKSQTYSLSEATFLRLDTDVAPMDDPRIREAIAESIDRKTIVKTLMQGIGEPAQQMVTSINNGYIPGFAGVPYDATHAKKLVAAAKADGVDVSVSIPIYNRVDLYPGEDQVIQAVVSDIKKVGLNAQQDNLDVGAWTIQNSRPFPADRPGRAVVSATNNNTGDAAFNFLTYMLPDQRHSVLDDPKVTALINQANSAPIGKTRSALFQKAAKIVYTTDYYMVPFAYLDGLLETSSRVNYKANDLTANALQIADVTFK
jgi:peptide/nickel transport system substrate-binding protein